MNAVKLIKDLAAVDYNSWQESEQGLSLAASLSKDIVLAEGLSPILTAILGPCFGFKLMCDSLQGTRNMTPVANTWPLWVIGGITRTRKSSSTE